MAGYHFEIEKSSQLAYISFVDINESRQAAGPACSWPCHSINALSNLVLPGNGGTGFVALNEAHATAQRFSWPSINHSNKGTRSIFRRVTMLANAFAEARYYYIKLQQWFSLT